jgi:putative transposase
MNARSCGEVWDHSAMESFFSSVKTEKIDCKVYRTGAQARADVFDYIELFYNPVRRCLTLGYVSPVEFEKAQEAWVGAHETGSSPPVDKPPRATCRIP